MRTYSLKTISVIAASLIFAIFAVCTISAAENIGQMPVSVMQNGRALRFEGASDGAFLSDGVTYVPLRGFCSIFGDKDISWDETARTATVHGLGLDITAKVGERFITVNDRPFYCESGVRLVSGSLFVPLRSIARAYGADVEWHTDSGHPGGGYAELSAEGRRADNAADVYDADVLYWLSRIISAESRGESLEGQIAVGNVILNRMRHSSFPSTVYDVIFDNKFGVQFTPTKNGTIYAEPAEISVTAAKICLEGYTLSEDILYFLNVSAASNLWVPTNRDHVMTIGCHDFYS